MPRWTSITADDLKAAGHGTLVDKARTVAVGAVDPVDDAIETFTAEVRNAVRAGNTLDTDATKIPLSLKRLTVRLVLYALQERIGMRLTDDQKREAERDAKRLEQLKARKEQVEPADNPDTVAGPVNPGTWNSESKILMRTHPVPQPGAQFPPVTGNYANPDAPQDATS